MTLSYRKWQILSKFINVVKNKKKMETIRVKCIAEKVSKDFSLYEFYYAANPDQEFEMPKCFIEASQLVRDWVGFPVRVTSTKRSTDSWGPHMKGLAIDLVTDYYIQGKPAPKSPEIVLGEFKTECENYIFSGKSNLISNLRAIGIDGFGIENTCIHLDTSYRVGNRVDKYGKYRVFVFSCHYDSKGQMVIDSNYAL